MGLEGRNIEAENEAEAGAFLSAVVGIAAVASSHFRRLGSISVSIHEIVSFAAAKERVSAVSEIEGFPVAKSACAASARVAFVAELASSAAGAAEALSFAVVYASATVVAVVDAVGSATQFLDVAVAAAAASHLVPLFVDLHY
eukprot:g277.t1